MAARQPSSDDRVVAFAFLKFLREASDDKAAVDEITQRVSALFDVSIDAKSAPYDKGVNLSEAVKEQVSRNAADPLKDEKFQSFLQLLQKKGYFANCEEGSSEYETRVRKALDKFQSRNTLTADQHKQKGNELMTEGKFQEAVQAYTRAIEMDGSNHVFYANRAAAQTYLKDYRAAIIDCERAIAIDATYVKAYSRLGNALFHEEQFERAVEVYRKAVELEPGNTSYKNDLKLAQDQLEEQRKRPVAAAPSGGNPFGLPGLDMERMQQMMSNPEMMKMAMQMAQNPSFQNMMMEAGQHARGSTPEEQLSSMMNYMRMPDAEGNIRTPLGRMNAERLRKLQEDEATQNPKMRAIMEEVRTSGPEAFYKHMGDPDVMALMNKMMSEMATDSP